MSNYTKQISWSGKDALSDSDPEKEISGGDFDTEFSAVQTAINSKIDGGTISNFTSTGIDDNATSTALEITTDGRGLSPFTARVWVVISGAGAIVDSHNISSTTRNATGDFTMTFANNLNNATYSRVGSTNDEGGSNAGDIGLLSFGTPTVSSLRIETGYLATSGSLVYWNYGTSTVIFGD